MKRIVCSMVVCSALAVSYAGGDAEEAKTWADKVKVAGDVRLRAQNDDEQGKTTREYWRLRARLFIDAEVSDDITAGLLLATGSASPTGENQTLTDGFSHKTLGITRAFVDWTAWRGSQEKKEDKDRVDIIGGKMKNPFINVNDIIWDTDVSPEGAALAARYKVGAVAVLLNGGGFSITERSGMPDTMMYAGQLAAKAKCGKADVTVGGTWYAYENMEGYAVVDAEGKQSAYGNSVASLVSGTTTTKVYATGFSIAEGFAEIGAGIPAGGDRTLPVRVFGQYVVNTEADENDTAYSCGLGVGKAKEAGSWEIGCSFARVEKDAVVGAFTDADRVGGGTDGDGYKFSARYQVAKNVQVGAAYFMSDKTISDASKESDFARSHVDLLVSF